MSNRFFLIVSALMLAIVLIGFAPSFYLRPYILPPEVFVRHGPTLPWYLILHGVVFTGWYVVACLQPVLVATNRTDLHRRLGLAGVFLAGAVVVVGLFTQLASGIVGTAVANLWSLVTLAVCVALGFTFRRRPGVHKRLMLFASIAIIAPALDRFSRVPPLGGWTSAAFASLEAPPNLISAAIGQWSLLLSVVIYDLVSGRRINRGTGWSLAVFFLISPAVTAAIMLSGLWGAMVDMAS